MKTRNEIHHQDGNSGSGMTAFVPLASADDGTTLDVSVKDPPVRTGGIQGRGRHPDRRIEIDSTAEPIASVCGGIPLLARIKAVRDGSPRLRILPCCGCRDRDNGTPSRYASSRCLRRPDDCGCR
jgi:hypothetical protein